jgi:hypothetical protein
MIKGIDANKSRARLFDVENDVTATTITAAKQKPRRKPFKKRSESRREKVTSGGVLRPVVCYSLGMLELGLQIDTPHPHTPTPPLRFEMCMPYWPDYCLLPIASRLDQLYSGNPFNRYMA